MELLNAWRRDEDSEAADAGGMLVARFLREVHQALSKK
jgi:hypothetical protein